MPKRQEWNLKFLNFNLSVDAQLPNHGNTQTQQIQDLQVAKNT